MAGFTSLAVYNVDIPVAMSFGVSAAASFVAAVLFYFLHRTQDPDLAINSWERSRLMPSRLNEF